MGEIVSFDPKEMEDRQKCRIQEKTRKVILAMKDAFTMDEIIRLVQGRPRKTIRVHPEPVTRTSLQVIFVLNDLERKGIVKKRNGKLMILSGIPSI